MKLIKILPIKNIAKKITTDTFFLGTSPVITEQHIAYIGEVVDSFMNK